MSFTKAATELFITQSAVSRQIKTLEEQIGMPLFLRGVRKLTLTDAGRELAATVNSMLNQLEITTSSLVQARAPRALGISTTVSFASLWLIPRLGSFRARAPLVDVRVSASSDVQDIKRQRLDIAIRYARPEAELKNAQVLFHEEVSAVCSPSLFSNPAMPLTAPVDLRNQVLLHMDDACGEWHWYEWSTWLAHMGVAGLRPVSTVRFSQYDQMIQAAVAGQGVALGRHPLITELLKQRLLVAPFQETPTRSGSYHLVTEPGSASRPEVVDFKSWLFEEASVGGLGAEATHQDHIAGVATPDRAQR